MTLPFTMEINRLTHYKTINHQEYALRQKFAQKFRDTITRTSRFMSNKVRNWKENNMNSPSVRERVAVELAREFLKEKRMNAKIGVKDWSGIAERVIDDSKYLRTKTEKNKILILIKMAALIEKSDFRKQVETELEIEASRTMGIDRKKLFGAPEGIPITLDLDNAEDIIRIASVIAKSCLEEEARDLNLDTYEYMETWRMYILSRENIENNTERNVERILQHSQSLLMRYYRNVEIEEQKDEISRQIGNYMRSPRGSIDSTCDLPEGSLRFKNVEVQRNYENLQESLADLLLEQEQLDPSSLPGLKP